MISVTQALRASGAIPEGPWYSEIARDRGTAVHMACRYLAEGDLDWASLEPAIVPRVRRFARWMSEAAPRWLAWEEEVCHAELGYIGHLDARCTLNGAEWVIDLKPTPERWHALQLWGYREALGRTVKMANLYYATPGEAARFIERKDRTARRVWRAALYMAKWRTNGTDHD